MIVFINGTISSGKSTIANLLKEKISNTVVLEVDVLRDLVDWMPLEESIPINLENVVSLIKNFSNRDINVIVPYPISQKNYNYLVSELKDIKSDIYWFTLNPDIKELIKSDRGRDLDDWEKKRIKYHSKIGLNKPKFGKLIDNTNQTPKETCKLIFDIVQK